MLEWIEPESWQAFIEMRRKIKAPLTPYAEKLIVRELVKLKQAGHDPQACLDQSIMNCWRDVYPLRDKKIANERVAATNEYLRDLDEHRAKAVAAPDSVRQLAQQLKLRRVQ
jgi:hypothetical protein